MHQILQQTEDQTQSSTHFNRKPIRTIFSLSNFVCHARIQNEKKNAANKSRQTNKQSTRGKSEKKTKNKIKYIMHIIISFPYSIVGLFAKRYFCAALVAAARLLLKSI